MGFDESRSIAPLRLHLADAPLLSPHYKVHSFSEEEGTLRVGMECQVAPGACPHCGGKGAKSWGRREQVIADVPRRGRAVQLTITFKRYRCSLPSCRKTFSQTLPAVADHRAMTQRLCRWVCEQALDRTYVSIAAEARLDEKTVRSVFADHLAKMRQQVRTLAAPCLAIVPVAALNGERYVILNTTHGMLIDVLEHRQEVGLTQTLKALKGREKVGSVSIGFDPIALAAVHDALPQAIPFIDPGAVRAVLMQGLLTARAAARAAMTPYSCRKMSGDVELLEAPEQSLTADQRLRLDGWFQQSPALREAYEFKRDVMALYGSAQRSAEPHLAVKAIEAAWSSLGPDSAHHFSAFHRLWALWGRYIANAFGPIEGLRFAMDVATVGELQQTVERSGRGNSIQAVRAKMLFPPSVPVFSMSAPGVSVSRLRTTLPPNRSSLSG